MSERVFEREVCGDVGRTAVGAAELAAFGGTDIDEERPLKELAGRARSLVEGSWWRTAGGPDVVVTASRVDARSSRAVASARGADGAVLIRLAPGQRDVATLAHELAHALAGVDHGHGGRFRIAAIDVLAALAGAAHGETLAASFSAFQLAVAERPWPPPEGPAGDTFVMGC